MGTERFNLVLRNYPEEMKLSDSRRVIYLHESEGDRIPKHVRETLGVQPGSKYYADSDGWIRNMHDDEKVIRNTKTAGTPKMQRINGQAIWDGSLDKYARNNMKIFLTEYFGPAIIRNLPDKLIAGAGMYLQFEFIFYVPIVLRKWTVQDIDNHAFLYIKAFMDTCTQIQLIEDDNARFFRGYYPRYVNCATEEERRLEIKIHFCKNDERIS